MPSWFRWLSRFEGISFLTLLFVAMPFKYYAGLPMVVKLMGPVHGLLFLAYWAGVFWLAQEEGWSGKKQLFAYVAGILPFGTFWFEKRHDTPVQSLS